MRFNVVAQVSERVARSHRRVRRMMLGKLSAVVAIVTVGACATGHASKSEQHQQQMVVHLTNDLAPPSDVTVYAVSTDGVRVLLGDVPPNDHRVLRIPGDIAAGTTFHILADRGLGRPVVSQPVTASSTDLIIDWDLQTNSMWFPEVGP
jgi:hypothetical protein